jgi:hypothetical protein
MYGLRFDFLMEKDSPPATNPSHHAVVGKHGLGIHVWKGLDVGLGTSRESLGLGWLTWFGWLAASTFLPKPKCSRPAVTPDPLGLHELSLGFPLEPSAIGGSPLHFT